MLMHSTRWKAAHLSGYKSIFPTSPSPFSTTLPLRCSLHQIYRVYTPHDGPRNIPPRSHPWASLSATMPKYFHKRPEESVLNPLSIGRTTLQGWQGWKWSKSVVKGSVEVLEKLKRERTRESKNGRGFADDRTLLLCWPDLDSGFATACLSAYTGDRLIYVGEARGGSTAEGSFFDALARSWLLEVSQT